jgi:broad specificity phosphatase PhoE
MTARLPLVCHASTEATRAAAFPADEPLEDKGRMRAAALAGGLPRAVRHWSSPELRTRQTAEALGLDAAIQPMLRECDYGRWTGSSFTAVQAREPEAVNVWLNDLSAAPAGGKSVLDLMERVALWLAAEQANQGQSIVVTHPTIIRAAIVHALEAAPRSFWRIDIAPLSVTRLSGTGGRWNVSAASCTAI